VGVRKRYVKLLYDVYAPKLQPGFGKRRHAVLVGPSAAAMLGTRWWPDDAPAELANAGAHAPRGMPCSTSRISDRAAGGVRHLGIV